MKVLGKLKRYGRAAEPLFFNKTTVYLMTHRWNFVMLGDMDRKELEWFRKNFIDSFLDMGKPEISEMIETDGKGLIPVSDLKNLIGNK